MRGQRVAECGKTAPCGDLRDARRHHDWHHAGGDAEAAAFVASSVVGMPAGVVGLAGAAGVIAVDAAAVVGVGRYMVGIDLLCRMRMTGGR